MQRSYSDDFFRFFKLTDSYDALLARFESLPALRYAARYEKARDRLRQGKKQEAAQLFRELYTRTLKDGELPPIDKTFRTALETDDPFPDYAFGGAVNSQFSTTLTVTNSRFHGNQAVGGNEATGTGLDIVGVGGAEGGAILSEVGTLATISGSTFNDNRAVGGSGNSGTGTVVLVGEGLGGAIVSGYGGGVIGSALLTLNDSILSHNEARGGDNNHGTGSVAGLVGAGAGAGLANYAGGTANVSNSVLNFNVARAGHGNSAVGIGVFANLGAGGGIFDFLGHYNSPPSDFGTLNASVVTVTNSLIAGNQAESTGGNALGGGIANLLTSTTTVSNSTLALNEADADGGSALGGGAYNDASSSLALMNAIVALNRADGATGIGGGVYSTGAFTHDPTTIIEANEASTSGDNLGP